MRIDLKGATLEQFTQFIFDHPVPAGRDEREWYFNEDWEVDYDPSHQIRLLTELFRGAGTLEQRYSSAQIEQGFWFVFNRCEEYFTNLLWDPAISWQERDGCIAAVGDLYGNLFPHVKVETIDYMIPDLLADTYGHGKRDPQNLEDRRVQDALFHMFVGLLARPEPISQYAGLHGLGHLMHPEGRIAIEAFLQRTPDLAEELRKYAAEAIAGDVL